MVNLEPARVILIWAHRLNSKKYNYKRFFSNMLLEFQSITNSVLE